VTPIERQTFEAWAELETYRGRIDGANQTIQDALYLYQKPYVAFSGGKDSLIMLHMILQQVPDILVWHWDYGPNYMPRNLEQEIIDICFGLGVKHLRIDSSPKYFLGRSETNVFFPALFGKVQPRLVEEGYHLVFVGLRAEESRKRAAKTIGNLTHRAPMRESYPIKDLIARDVWAYIVENDLPYCSHYDRYGELLGIENVRMATFFDPEFYKYGANHIDGVLMPHFKNPEHKYAHRPESPEDFG